MTTPPARPNRVLLVLAAVVSISFLYRLPRLPQLISQHDWLTSHTVLITRIWQMAGPSSVHYAPSSTWPNDADRFIELNEGTVFDARGNGYFLSFPPFAFYVSYAFFSVLGEGASAFPLRLLMIALATAGAVLLTTRAARWLRERETPLDHYWAAAVAGAMLLSPAALFFFSRSFFPLTLSLPLWMAAGALFVSLRERETPRPLPAAALGVLCFLLCYTDWLGVLACATYAALLLAPSVRPRTRALLLAAIAAGAVLALALTAVQYSSIAGSEALLGAWKQRLGNRAGLSVGAGDQYALASLQTWKAIARNYWVGFGPVLVTGAVLFAALLIRRRPLRGMFAPRHAVLLVCFLVPVALDHLLLSNHTANHRYAVLKAAPAAGLLLGALVLAHLQGAGVALRRATWALLATAAVFCFLSYRRVRTEFPVEVVSSYVEYQAGLDRVIFLEQSPVMPYLDPTVFALAGRNVKLVRDRDEAARFLARRPGHPGFYLRFGSADPTSLRAELLPEPRR